MIMPRAVRSTLLRFPRLPSPYCDFPVSFTLLRFPGLADIYDMFEWNSKYSVGIGSIDAQHQMLFAIADELFNALSAGKGQTVLRKILDRLLQYTASHFAHEERLMRLHDYPDLAKHKAQHEALTNQVNIFSDEFKTGRAAISVQVMIFLKDWLTKHIQQSDRAYAPFLIGKAVA